jgi:hypothetical protein
MRCSSLLLRPEPRCEIVERNAQSRGNLGERGGGERLAAEAAMGAPNADRVLTGADAAHQRDRQIVGARLFLTECRLARLGRSNCSEVFGFLEALDQRLVLGAAEQMVPRRNPPPLSSKASRSRLGISARAFDAARVTISLMSPSVDVGDWSVNGNCL